MPDPFGDDWCYLLTAQCPEAVPVTCCTGMTLPSRLWVLIENIRDATTGVAVACACLEGHVFPIDHVPGSVPPEWDAAGDATACTGEAPNEFVCNWTSCFPSPPFPVQALILTDCPAHPGVFGGGSADMPCTRPFSLTYTNMLLINNSAANCCGGGHRLNADVTVFE